MRVILICATWLGIAVGSQLRFQQRTSTQEFEVGSRAQIELNAGAALVGEPICDSELSGSICYSMKSGRKAALLPNAVPSGLVGHWNFDADTPIDSSGGGNHGRTELLHGPSPAGNGHSAAFTRTFMMVPSSEQLKLSDFTYSFWVYLFDDGTPASALGDSAAWCPLIRKGIHMAETEQYASAPTLLFNHKTGQLRAEVTTSVKDTEDAEYVDSSARLLSNRWIHVAMVHHSKNSKLLLYVNGILDSVLKTEGTLVTNDYPLYVGGDPFTMGQCGFTVYMDELRVYSHAVAPHQLQAEAAPALGGADPNYVRLGCMHCTLAEAAESCPKDRHVCTSIELHTGGFQVARSVGWLASGVHVWTHAAVTKGADAEMSLLQGDEKSGLGLCCEGPP